jgi:hypothetical protein
MIATINSRTFNPLSKNVKISIYKTIILARAEEREGWRKLHKEKLHNLYCMPSIIRIIKSRRMRWTG